MAFLYPWGNTQQLNLDWILQKIKELETGSGGNVNMAEVANALISATYSQQAYDRSDIVYRDGKLYRANQTIPAPGEAWTPAHWDEILLGDTVSNLVQYVATLSNDQIVNSSGVTGTHTSDALDNLNGAISAETTRASTEENALATAITNEITARQNADTALSNSISSESSARQNADATLQTNINNAYSNVISQAQSVIETWLQNNITNPSSPPLDRTLLLANAAAPADIVNNLKKYNVFDFIEPYRAIAVTASRQGVTYTWSGGKCTAFGLSSGTTAFNNFTDKIPLGDLGVEKGKTYYVKYASTNVDFIIYSFDSSDNQTEALRTKTDTVFAVPSNAEKLLFRLITVGNGTSVNEILEPKLMSSATDREIADSVDNCYKSWNVEFEGDGKFYLSSMPLNSVAFIQPSTIKDADISGLPVSNLGTCYLEKIGRGSFAMYRLTQNAYGNVYYAFKIGSTIRWRGAPFMPPTHIGLIGDSVMWGRIGGVIPVQQTDYGIPYWVSMETGQIADNLGVGSMGWISTQYLNYNAEDYVQTLDYTNYDMIAFMLGANDGMAQLGTYTDTTEQTILGAMYRCCAYIMSQKQNIRIVLINHLIGKSSAFPYFQPEDPHYTGWTWTQLFEQTRLFAKKYGFTVIEAWESMNAWNRQTLIGDNIHPTENGYKVVGTFIAGAIKSIL